jgi:hypothetical protein
LTRERLLYCCKRLEILVELGLGLRGHVRMSASKVKAKLNSVVKAEQAG